MKVKGSRRLVARLGLALAVAAIAVPTAHAMPVNVTDGSGGSVRLYADDLHASVVPTPSRFQRQYADDLHAPFVSNTLLASNVRTDAASVRISLPASNVRTDAASFRGSPSQPGNYASIDPRGRLDLIETSSQPGNYASIDPRGRLDLIETSSQPVSSDPGIDWSVAGIGAAFGALGLMLLGGVVFFMGRHQRRSRLAAA
jgi:hypothetical protein